MLSLTDQLLEEVTSDRLTAWLAEYGQRFALPDVKQSLRSQLIQKLMNCGDANLPARLEAIRVLGREKTGLDDAFSNSEVKKLLSFATLDGGNNYNGADAAKVKLEARKCLCNLLFNSKSVLAACANQQLIEILLKQLSASTNRNDSLLLLKLLFLLTSLTHSQNDCPNLSEAACEQDGLRILTEILCSELSTSCAQSNDFDLFVEATKLVYNLCSLSPSVSLNNTEDKYDELASTLGKAIRLADPEKIESSRYRTFMFEISAVATALPQPSLWRLVSPIPTSPGNVDTNVLDQYIEYLKSLIDKPQDDSAHLLTALIALSKIAKTVSPARRYLRSIILPKLSSEDLRRLPNEGPTLRNKICRLMAGQRQDIKEHSADFLFILCKEKSSRFIKQTGFGNAAGLLANRGLLGAESSGSAEYSDSEDESEDENAAADAEVNMITGRIEPTSRLDPFDGMTEEQKEFEVMKLVNMLDQLQRNNEAAGSGSLLQPVLISGQDPMGATNNPPSSLLEMRERMLAKSEDARRNNSNSNDED